MGHARGSGIWECNYASKRSNVDMAGLVLGRSNNVGNIRGEGMRRAPGLPMQLDVVGNAEREADVEVAGLRNSIDELQKTLPDSTDAGERNDLTAALAKLKTSIACARERVGKILIQVKRNEGYLDCQLAVMNPIANLEQPLHGNNVAPSVESALPVASIQPTELAITSLPPASEFGVHNFNLNLEEGNLLEYEFDLTDNLDLPFDFACAPKTKAAPAASAATSSTHIATADGETMTPYVSDKALQAVLQTVVSGEEPPLASSTPSQTLPVNLAAADCALESVMARLKLQEINKNTALGDSVATPVADSIIAVDNHAATCRWENLFFGPLRMEANFVEIVNALLSEAGVGVAGKYALGNLIVDKTKCYVGDG